MSALYSSASPPSFPIISFNVTIHLLYLFFSSFKSSIKSDSKSSLSTWVAWNLSLPSLSSSQLSVLLRAFECYAKSYLISGHFLSRILVKQNLWPLLLEIGRSAWCFIKFETRKTPIVDQLNWNFPPKSSK